MKRIARIRPMTPKTKPIMGKMAKMSPRIENTKEIAPNFLGGFGGSLGVVIGAGDGCGTSFITSSIPRPVW